MNYRPLIIYLEQDILEEPFTKTLLTKFPKIPTKIIEKVAQLKDLPEHPKKKRPLVLAKNRGNFFEKCPGTSKHICCNYFILNLGIGCPYDCSYCFLQFYQKIPVNIIYTNLSDLQKELAQKIGNQKVRLGTGEFMDSLALENILDFNETILPLIFEVSPNITLELKTKSTNIALKDTLKQYPVVFGWSLNPENLARSEEKFAPTIKQRLAAIHSVQQAGFRVALHFDPIILQNDWQKQYTQLIEQVADNLNIKQLAWFSLGLLRFVPQLKKVIERRHPRSTIIYGEFFPGDDKKMRYPQALRIEVFKFFRQKLFEKFGSEIPLYFCMESSTVWQEVFGDNALNKNYLSEIFS